MLLPAGLTHVPAGTLVVALAALNYNGEGKKDKVMNAFLVLRCLVSSRFLPSADAAANMTVLLHLQGLRRISALLCPIICPKVFELLLKEKSVCLACAEKETHLFRLMLEERSVCQGFVLKGDHVCLDFEREVHASGPVLKGKSIYVYLRLRRLFMHLGCVQEAQCHEQSSVLQHVEVQ